MVSIHWPLGYRPSTLSLCHPAGVVNDHILFAQFFSQTHMPSIRLEIARNYFFTFRFNIWNRLLKWSRRGSSFRLSHILRSVYKFDALTNWALRLACWSGGIIFAFIARGRGLDFCASPYFIHLPLSRIPKTFRIQ